MHPLAKGAAVVGLPITVVAGLLLGRYVGAKFGNAPVGMIIGVFASLIIGAYDIYTIAISPGRKGRGARG